MAASLAAPINPALLVWARETAGYSVEAAAGKLGLKPEKLDAIERGNPLPSFAQVKKAADVYKRPLAVFFLPQAPETQTAVHDFRLQPGVSQRPYAPRLNAEIRQARLRREDALELSREIEQEIPAFQQQASIDEAPEAVAVRVRQFLGIALDRQFAFRRTDDALKAWKAAVEAQSVLVFETSRIPQEEMRGVSLPGDVLPIVILNGGDVHAGRIFTLLHELTHLFLRQGGVCDMVPIEDGSPDARVEAFCNAVAGNVLVPVEALLSALPRQGVQAWTMEEFDDLARHFSVSRYVILRRLLTVGGTTQAHYHNISAKLDEEQQQARDKSRGESVGGPPPSVMAVRNLGRPFVRLVLDAYAQDRIALATASDYLGVKIRHLSRIESLVFGREASA
ncbi:XRE family transcriptional regulator [Accumulibacter sp.]|uniref:XRE family transcriptional regulator n=1 Tax=Accumulibacter sp. TaxID=2053492 RepID=UPI00260FAA10|nr:XRE family transcriptional regulator [Accumulibacter sp.]